MMQLVAWSDDAARGLSRALISSDSFDAIADARARVEAGSMQLWCVNGHSFALTESMIEDGRRITIVWCYEGREYHRFTEHFKRVAKANQIDVIRFETGQRAILRMLRRYNPHPVANGFYDIEVSKL